MEQTDVKKYIAKDEVLGVFTNENKDIVVTIPTFDELCCWPCRNNNGKIEYLDIRMFDNDEEIMDILNSDNIYINKKYMELYDKYLKLKSVQNIDNVKKTIITHKNKYLYKEDLISGIREIIKLSLKKVNKNFKQELTKTEKRAFQIILSHLSNGSGNISISNLLLEIDAPSRPVFTTLLQKMQSNNVAEVANNGMKGTYIKILDNDLL